MRGFCTSEAPYLSKPAPQSNQENSVYLNFAFSIWLQRVIRNLYPVESSEGGPLFAAFHRASPK
jgi:hypothetical protein